MFMSLYIHSHAYSIEQFIARNAYIQEKYLLQITYRSQCQTPAWAFARTEAQLGDLSFSIQKWKNTWPANQIKTAQISN